MLHIEKIVFTDDESGKEVSVHLDGKVEAVPGMTPDEYFIASFHTGLLVSGGLSEVEKFTKR